MELVEVIPEFLRKELFGELEMEGGFQLGEQCLPGKQRPLRGGQTQCRKGPDEKGQQNSEQDQSRPLAALALG